MFRTRAEFEFPLATSAAEVFSSVWRTTLDWPGFALLHPSEPLSASDSRQVIVTLAEEFSRLAVKAGEAPFAFERQGRFDQQVTTKFHRDGAPDASLLVLAYEPTSVPSRLFIADAAAAASESGVGVNAFLATHNPMFPAGEAYLRGFITELAWPVSRGAVVVINNSLFPDGTEAGHPIGVLHKGDVLQPDPTAKRVINSVGLAPVSAGRELAADVVAKYLASDSLY